MTNQFLSPPHPQVGWLVDSLLVSRGVRVTPRHCPLIRDYPGLVDSLPEGAVAMTDVQLDSFQHVFDEIAPCT